MKLKKNLALAIFTVLIMELDGVKAIQTGTINHDFTDKYRGSWFVHNNDVDLKLSMTLTL